MAGFDPAVKNILQFLNKNVQGVFQAWKQLAQAKAQDPRRFDYVTVEERLRTLHVTEFGETLYEHAKRVSDGLPKALESQSLILWRALSGIYVQGATGRVRALILPQPKIANSVFALTEVKVLLLRTFTGRSAPMRSRRCWWR